MPHRRPRKRGSFGSHFDELVVHFATGGKPREKAQSHRRSQELQDKIDIHRLLFESAWKLDERE